MRTVIFYFDVISPYAWLASLKVEQLERVAGVRVEYVPVLFAGLLNAHGTRGPAEVPAKRDYVFLDAMRLAAKEQVGFLGPPSHPFNPLRALRMCTALTSSSARKKLANRLLDATWREGKDLTVDETLIECATQIGEDGRKLLDESSSESVKGKLKAQTEEAIGQGVFGVPSFWEGGELFWGFDRISLLEAYLRGELSVDKAHLKTALARPRAADRRTPP